MRCIKPNANQCGGIFDQNLVKFQLILSGSIAYQQLMRVGFPSHFSIARLFDMFESNSDFKEYTKNPKDFCKLLLQSCGLKLNQFKLGNTQIFFRSGKLMLLSEKLKDEPKIIKERLDKHIYLRRKFKAVILAARLCVKGRCIQPNNLVNEIHPENASEKTKTVIPQKKLKLSKSSSKGRQQIEPVSTGTTGSMVFLDLKKCLNS